MTDPKNDFPFIRKDILVRKVKIYGKVETLSALRIGKGRGETNPLSPATMQIIRTYDGKPLIPGSTWKGIFRSTGEKIAKEKGIYTCTGLTKQTCMDQTLNDSKNSKVLDIFQDYLASNNIDEAIKLVWDYTCINCKIFGGPSLYSAVSILDSVAEKFNIEYRAMIAISRKTGAVTGRALATVEYVEPGSIFPFMLIGNNLPNYALGYIIKIMRYINEGMVQVGGNKSRGFGFVKFHNLTLEVSDYSGGKLKALDEMDKEVEIELPKNSEDFFVNTKKLEGCFDNVEITFPKNTVHS